MGFLINRFLLLGFFFLIGCQSIDSNNYGQGKETYALHCQNCHGENGDGLKKLIPTVVNSDYVKKNQDKLACIIRYGISDTILVNGDLFTQPMPGNEYLSSTNIANLINYINRDLNGLTTFVTPDQTAKQLEDCKPK